MAVFVLVITRSGPLVRQAIDQLIPDADRYSLTEDAWLISYNGTARLLSESLGVRGGEIGGAAVVFSVENYSGRASRDVWEWLRLHMAEREA